MESKVFMKVKGFVFECMPSNTELEYENLGQGGLADPCVLYTLSSFKAAIVKPQPWTCKTQKMWKKLPNKKRVVHIVMVTDNVATEWVFTDVDITFASEIDSPEFTVQGPTNCRPLIPIVKGETREKVKTTVHTKGWWENA